MALRVLLADESNTIKKVFQLALQDYAVEVRTVNVGIDVIAVAKQFQPDIIFADVLLQKRSGYEVSSDIKSHKELSEIPVILIWSGFMDLDHDKYNASQANANLEKPFDVSSLRALVMQFVEKTKVQRLSNYLTFPKVTETESTTSESTSINIPLPPPIIESQKSPSSSGEMDVVSENIPEANWNMESFDSITKFGDKNTKKTSAKEESFTHHKLQSIVSPSEENTEVNQTMTHNILEDLPSDAEEVPWIQKDLSQFKIRASQHLDTENEEVAPVNFNEPETAVVPRPHLEDKLTDELQTQEFELEIETLKEESPIESKKLPKNSPPSTPQLSEEQLLNVIKAQSQETIERVVWQVVPELAKQIIERELKRLLAEKFSKD